MKEWLDGLYINTVDFEMKMQGQLLDTMIGFSGTSGNIKENVSPSKTTLEYSNYLLQASSRDSFSEIVSAIATCPWTYLEITQPLSKYHIKIEVYRNWIQFYCSDESQKQVGELKQIINSLSESMDEESKYRMKNHFASACNYEYLF